jgi:hypothetical protein
MAQQKSSEFYLYYKDPSYKDQYLSVERTDQLQAIKQYLTNGVPKQSVPHRSGVGTFDVTFDDLPTFSYNKDDVNKTRVEILFATPSLIDKLNSITPENKYRKNLNELAKSKYKKPFGDLTKNQQESLISYYGHMSQSLGGSRKTHKRSRKSHRKSRRHSK